MKYNVPYGKPDEVTWGDQPYINGDPSTGRQGSIPPAASIEYPQREIVNLILDAARFSPSNSDLHQLGRAIQSGALWFGVDTGGYNNMQVTLAPPPLGLYQGLTVAVLAAHLNTSSSATLNVNGLGARPIVRADGSPLAYGDIPQGSILNYRYDGTKWQAIGVSMAAAPLRTNMTVYVNGATGNDSFDGSSATVSGNSGPFRTIGKAVLNGYNYAPGPYVYSIIIAAGVYPEGVYSQQYAGPQFYFNGAGSTQTTIIAPTDMHALCLNGGTSFTVENLCVQTAGGVGPPCGIVGTAGANIWTNNTASNYTLGAAMEAWASTITVQNHTISAGSINQAAFQAIAGGNLNFHPRSNIFIAGAWTATGGTVAATLNGIITVGIVGTPPTWSGPGVSTVNGPRYLAASNGSIYTQGLGETFFPGSSPGLLMSGGQYG